MKTAKSAPRDLACWAKSRMRAELPSKSPTVGLNWARAIFMRSYRIRFGRGLIQICASRRGVPERGTNQPPDSYILVGLEECDFVIGANFFENLMQDVRFAWRTLRRAPGFAATAILALGLGNRG